LFLLRCVFQQAFESTKRGWAEDLKAVNILLGKTVAARKADYAAKVIARAAAVSEMRFGHVNALDPIAIHRNASLGLFHRTNTSKRLGKLTL
jgi:hypothetical protein